MKTVACRFSDEFVARVIEVGRIFGEPTDFGHIVEHYAGHVLSDLANDPDSLLCELRSRTWDSEEKARQVAVRAQAKFPELGQFQARPAVEDTGRWEIGYSPTVEREEAPCA